MEKINKISRKKDTRVKETKWKLKKKRRKGKSKRKKARRARNGRKGKRGGGVILAAARPLAKGVRALPFSVITPFLPKQK